MHEKLFYVVLKEEVGDNWHGSLWLCLVKALDFDEAILKSQERYPNIHQMRRLETNHPEEGIEFIGDVSDVFRVDY